MVRPCSQIIQRRIPRPAYFATLFLGLALVTGASHASDYSFHRYRVTIGHDLKRLVVSACLGYTLPQSLRSGSRDASRFITGELTVTSSTPGASAHREGHTIALRDFEVGDCVNYSVDLGKMTDTGDYRDGFKVGQSVMTNPGNWLLMPHRDRRPVAITFYHPVEFGVSAPWQRSTKTPGTTHYVIDDIQRSWPSRVAFGRLGLHDVDVPGGTLRVALLDGDPPLNTEQTLRWIKSTASSVVTLYGRFPLPSPQVTVTPIGPRDEPVPWGHVLRGGGTAAHFYVDPTRPASEFEEDWTATHEFSHMLLPYINRRDAWLSEGLASYYQNVLRARSGLLTPEQAWERTLAGMNRGERNVRDRLSLAETSRQMSENGSYRRVYWSGAAYALEADVALRRATGGKQSLDTALAALQACCLPATRAWRASELISRLDKITGTTVFSDLHEQYMPMRRFPSLDGLYDDLGIQQRGNDVRLDRSATDYVLGESIMGQSAD